MGDAAYSCVKCGSQMVKGYAADHGNNSSVFGTMWFDGEPEQAKLFGLTGDNLTVDRSQKKTVRGLRCTRCGYLELYAV
jgi:predicted nucleic-acid-binding Zn-ribbon protein